MSDVFKATIGKWLQAGPVDEGIYKLNFTEHHLGNIWIRSLHGGVTAAMIETSAEMETRKAMDDGTQVFVSSSSIDYLRITKDADLYTKATIQRKSRRLAVVDVICWQDTQDVPVARGVVTLKLG